MARTKTVYPTNEIAHLWAHQTTDYARNPQSNFYFRGPTLFSYRDNYPIAQLNIRPKGETLALIRADTYSVTTSGHISDAHRAVNHLRAIVVPDVLAGTLAAHGANLEFLLERSAAELKKAGRALSESRARWGVAVARDRNKDAHAYAKFFGIRRKLPSFDETAADRALERARRIENPDPQSLDKRERARAARAQAVYARDRLAEIDREIGAPDYSNMARRTDWRLGGAFGAVGYRAPGAPMLRVDGEEIETSWGARVPLAAAPMVWARVQCAIRKGGYERNADALGGMKIGNYTLDAITADGALRAGCHVIPHSELATIARQLKLA